MASGGRPPFDRVLSVDWEAVVNDLQRCYVRSGRSLALRLGVPSPSLRSYAENASEPCHRTGERIVAVWMSVMKLPREALPMRECVVRRYRVGR